MIRQHAAGWAGLALLTAAGVALGLQGWRGFVPDMDYVPDINNVRDLLAQGRLPAQGNLSSFNSVNTPGPSWLYVPGVLLFKDLRLIGAPGSAFLYGMTLLGLFLLGRRYFGTWCALLAVGVYGLSEPGLQLAESLWPRNPPQCFFIWTVYWAVRWVEERNPWYAALAFVTVAAGMYVFMEMTPALLLFPVLWLVYRPPLRPGPLLAAMAAGLVIWFPYLRFEASRGFVDLQCVVRRADVTGTDPTEAWKATWCDKSLAVRFWKAGKGPALSGEMAERPHAEAQPFSDPPEEPEAGWRRLLKQGNARISTILQNFNLNEIIPGAAEVMFFLTLGVVVLLSVLGTKTGTPELARTGDRSGTSRGFWNIGLTGLAFSLILAGLCANERTLGRFLLTQQGLRAENKVAFIHRLQFVLILSGSAVFFRRPIAAALHRLARQGKKTTPLVLGLVVPWFTLCLLVEEGRGDRFKWLWPLQALVLAALVSHLLSCLRSPRLVAGLGQVALVLFLVANPVLLYKVEHWHHEGWAGGDADQVRALGCIAREVHAARKAQAAIGYQIFFEGINPWYRLGSEYNLLLADLYGVTNTNQCPEGISVVDEYRVVEKPPPIHPVYIAGPPLTADFHLLGEFGTLQVYQRQRHGP